MILQETLRECTAIVKAASPNSSVIVFNDMYDPEHNALPRLAVDDKNKVISFYPMINGDLSDSWKDMGKSITILNWQTASKSMNDPDIASWKRSLCHFKTNVGVKQVISGFYDVLPEAGNASEYVTQRAEAMFSAAKEDGIEVKPVAVCYYTTRRNTAFLKEFAAAADKHWAP